MPTDDAGSYDGSALAHKGISKLAVSVGKLRLLEVNRKIDEELDLSDAPSETDEPHEQIAFEAAKRRVGLGTSPLYIGGLMLCNTLLGGSGMLGISYAFSESGYALGLIFVCFFGLASAFGCNLLHCTARKLGRAPCSFYSVTSTVAPRWVFLIDGAVMVKCFGVATSYLIIAGDLVPDALTFFGLADVPRWQAITAGFAIAGPLACFRDLSALRYTAAASLLIVVWIAVVLALFFLRSGPSFQPCLFPLYLANVEDGDGWMGGLPCGGAAFEPFPHNPNHLARVLPIFVFNFTCQQNVFAICNEAKQATGKRLDRVITVAYCIAGSAASAVALFGYATYGDKVASNVLKSGYPKNEVTEATHLLVSCVAVFSFPVQANPSRVSALALLRPMLGGGGSFVSGLDPNPERAAAAARSEKKIFWIVTAVWLTSSYTLALAVQDLGQILALVGASGSTAVSYILPGLLYIRTFPRTTRKWYMALALCVGGLTAAPLCLFAIIFGGAKH